VRRLELLRLELRRFKGVEHFVLELDATGATVYGDNATGKTTLHDAFTWLLFGKDASDRKIFAIKPLDDAGRSAATEAEVSATFRTPDGADRWLRRAYREVWTKRRGSSRPEFTGHETAYWVDDVPAKAKEYDAAVAALAPDERAFRLLTDPHHFSETLTWQERRAMLLETFGDVDDAELAAAHPELAELLEIRGRHSHEDHGKILAQKRKATQAEIAAIPVRISEAQRGAEDAGDVKALEARVVELDEEIGAAREELEEIRAAGAAPRLRAELVEAKAAAGEIERRFRDSVSEALRGYERTVLERRELVNAIATRLERLERERPIVATAAEAARDGADRAREEWLGVSRERYEEPSLDESCPACGRPLPPERLEAARAKAAEEWRERQARRLEEIRANGAAAAARAKAYAADLETLDRENERVRAEAVEASAMLRESEEELERARASDEIVDAPEGLDAALELIREIQAVIAEAESGGDTGLDEARERLERATRARETAAEELAGARAAAKARDRVAELKASEEALARELEEIDRVLSLRDSYTRYKVGALEEKIGGHFALARFRLFDEQINEGLRETCETTYRGVPWPNLNHGAKINVGLDIIDVLGERLGFYAPIWIDNAESVTSLATSRGQQIRLVVSGADAKLRVEQETAA
jgi:hypothetical protein